MQAPSMP